MQLVGMLWLIVVIPLLFLKLFTRIAISRWWLLLAGIAPVIAVHIVNPLFRVWSFHSLMHGGIVYQIINGNIPPPAPLVGGTPLRYPWGAHLLAATLCKAFNVTPFTSIAALNAASLLLSMILAYRISKLLIDDERANILSAVTTFFATSWGSGGLTSLLPGRVPTEFRGIPLLGKFCTTNALPLGVLFLLLFMFFALRLLRPGGTWRNLIPVAASVIGCGFFYAPFLPGLAAGAGLVFVLSLVFARAGGEGTDVKKPALLIAVTAACLLVLRPHLTSIGGGIVSQADWFAPGWMGTNLLRYLVAALPLLVVVLLSWNRIKAAAEHRGLVFMTAIAAGNLVCYLLIHLPFKGEYKFLHVSLVALSILGGIGLRTLMDRTRTVTFAILVFLLFQAFTIITRTYQGREELYHYRENGMTLETSHEQREEVYAWIRANTPADAIFLDDEIEIPALAQRQLYVPPRQFWTPPPRRGYGLVRSVLGLQSGYVPDLLEPRAALLKKIYDPRLPLTRQEMDQLRSLPGRVYLVSTGRELTPKFDRHLEEVFRTSMDGYRVYLVPE